MKNYLKEYRLPTMALSHRRQAIFLNVNEELPQGISLAYDGLRLEI